MRYTVSLTAINLVARGCYFLVFLLVGNLYGSTVTTDTVFLMYAPAAIAATVIAGICQIVVMPFVHRAHALKCDKTFRRHLLGRALAATLCLAPLVLIASFFVSGKTHPVALLLVPIPALASISGIYSALLNASGKFRAAALGPIYGAGLAGISLITMPTSAAGLGSTLLCFELGRAISMYVHGRAVLADTEDTEPSNAPRLLAESLRAMWQQGVASLLVALNPLVDMLFATTLGAGAVSSVEYANRMWALIPLLFSGPLMIFHSRASVSASRGELLLKDVNREVFRLGAIAFGVGILLIWLTQHWLIDLLYGWGHMDSAAKNALTNLFIAYLTGTAAYVVGLIYVRVFSATAQISFIMKSSALSVVLNAALDWLLIRFFGLTGLGIATSLTCLAVAIFLYAALRRANAKVLN